MPDFQSITGRFCCGACGTTDLRLQAVVSAEDWAKVCAGRYALCVPCMDKAFAELGMVVDAVLTYAGQAIRTPVSPEVRRVMCAWRLPELLREGAHAPRDHERDEQRDQQRGGPDSRRQQCGANDRAEVRGGKQRITEFDRLSGVDVLHGASLSKEQP